jgi:N-glycosylase/DNA lyase
MRLTANGPFNLQHTLESGQAFRWRREGEWHAGIVQGCLFRVRQVSGESIEFTSTPLAEAEAAPILQSYLRLDDDLRAIYRRMGKDRHVRSAIRRYHGMRLISQEPWECLVTFVVSQNSNIPRIAKNINAICERYGALVETPAGPFRRFPGVNELARATQAELAKLGLGYRDVHLVTLTRQVAQRRINLLGLRKRPYVQAKATLERLRGVGPKVADCVLAFSLDKGQAFPVDVHIRRAVKRWYLPGQNVTDKVVREWAAAYFGKDAAYAQQYLFHRQRQLGSATRRG